MPPEVLKYLEDMRVAADDIATFTQGKSFADYLQDKQLRMAVERAFEILGEALTQLRRLSPDTAAKISEHRAIISFRNVLIHGYATVNHTITWDIVQTELPTLQREIKALLPA